ncbi:hypothetical protein KAR28_01205 [Candidatus Parcubacteria bacterium]|nr:hypothetical protein [Candidatus Parcubacteria bacterium]
MVNLLRDNLSGAKKNIKAKKGNSAPLPIMPPEPIKSADKSKVNIGRYKDPEGLSVGKLETGLWFLKHRKKFLYALYAFLITTSVVSWSIFIYSFGHYVLIGMVEDSKMLDDLTRFNNAIPIILLRQKAQPILAQTPIILMGAGAKTDFVTKIINPNLTHWAEFQYVYKDSNGNIIAEHKNFILPNESKHLLSLGHDGLGSKPDIKFEFSDISWGRVTAHDYPDWEAYMDEHLNIEISDKKFTPAMSTILTESLSLNEVSFTAKNLTAYNYYDVNFIILLSDNTRITSANQYLLENFLSGESRDIVLTWPGRLGRIRYIDIVGEINITDEQVYVSPKASWE